MNPRSCANQTMSSRPGPRQLNKSAIGFRARQVRGAQMAAGWNVRVTTFDSEGRPGIVRYFLAYEPDKERAIESVRKRVPVYEGEVAEAVTEVTANELLGQTMRPGDVKQGQV